ncbi:unnamed protein product [Phaedon cochleariae]|uniref:Protein odr-4 homolog n=1 Tax=Phaedon cochleariae TaxID=80249 RepID=A0A9P0GP12_PHACE|nr:unnamed protein product [Phaedon cochleariae]
MVRTAIIDEHLLSYLNRVAQQNTYAMGLILGQSCTGKDYVMHFAKTPPFHTENDKNLNEPEKLKSLDQINENWMSDHARQTTRMLPGGMHVLGVFVISPDSSLNPFNPKVKAVLQRIHGQLETNTYLYGNSSSEKLVVHYDPKTQKCFCKAYDVTSHIIQPAEVKTVAKKWNSVQCDYGIDKIQYIRKFEVNYPLEKHINALMNEIHDNLAQSVFLFNGEYKEGDESIENVGKNDTRHTRSNKGRSDNIGDSKPVIVSIFQSKLSEGDDASEQDSIIETGGQLRLVGKVSSKLWLQPKLSIKEASDFIRQDIMRSLVSRLEMHWDSLTEEENSEDINCLHEPPRRVLIALPNSEVTLSDYLFPGEGPQDAKVSFEELLDIKINGKLTIQDVEGQADISEYQNSTSESDSKEVLTKFSSETNKIMYLALVIALIVLVLALLLHFYQ